MITRTNSHSHSRSIEPEPEPELELELEPEPEPSSSSNTNNNNYSSSSSSPDLLYFPSPTTLLSSPTRFATSSSMLRPRPRLPAGPRTRKQTTLLGSSSSSSSKDQDPSFQHHPSLHSSDPAPAWTAPGSGVQLTDPFSPSPQSLLPPLSTTLPAQQSINQQTELPIPIPDRSLPSHPPPSSSSYSYSTTPLSPHDPLQTTSSPSQDQLPLDPQHVSIQLTPDTSRAGTPTLPLTLSTSLMSPAPPRKPSQATISSISPPINPPPAQLDITPEPLPYKHLTLDAAHWALTSTELQSLVSSAIRESAKEQFIRLLPPSDIDSRLPEDSARIERSWDTASARWRFEAHRRNMLLRALAASGADGELLTQLSNTLCNIDTHAKDLLHASIHRNQLAAARDTHRASALAVALRKLNASYARRTRDLDKARAQIATLRSEVDEAWNAAHKEATEVDRLKTAAATKQREAVTDNITPTNAATTTATTTTTTTTTGGTEDPTDITDDDNAYEDDTSGSALPDGASVDLTTVSRAEVIDVMGKAIAAQARFTMMRTDHPSGSRPPPSAFGRRRSQSSPVTSRSNTPHRQLSIASQVSRASAARRRSIRKNKAGLRLPTSVRARSSSRSVVRGESGSSSNHKAQSKNRNKMGNESVRAEPPIPWLPMDAVGSFLEMEGRPTGEEDGDGDGDGDGDDNVEGDEEGEEEEEEGEGEKEKGEESRSVDISRAATGLPTPRLRLSPLTPVSAQRMPGGVTTTSPSTFLPSPFEDEVSPQRGAQQHDDDDEHDSQRSPNSAVVPSTRCPRPESSTTDDATTKGEKECEEGRVADLIPDPASIFAPTLRTTTTTTTATTTTTTTTTSSSLSTTSTGTATSGPDLDDRRGHSLDLPSSKGNGGKENSHHAGAKIRRSISELLHFGSSSSRSSRRRSSHHHHVLVGGSNNNNSNNNNNNDDDDKKVGISGLGSELKMGLGRSEDGWEDTRGDDGA